MFSGCIERDQCHEMGSSYLKLSFLCSFEEMQEITGTPKSHSEAFSEPSETSKMEYLAKFYV